MGFSNKQFELNFHKLEKAGKLKDYEYEEDILLKYRGKEKVLMLPNCFSEIDSDAFTKNRHLRRINIPESYNTIGNRAFWGCSNLNTVEFNDGIEIIGNSTFSDCAIWSLELPSSVTSIGNLAFSNNKQLRFITVKGKDTWFENDTFRGCLEVDVLSIHRELHIGNVGLNMDAVEIEYK